MSAPLSSLTIRGFRSIRSLDAFPLDKLNVLVGANGAGKSNFVDFFRMLRAMAEEALQGFTRENGGADGFFFDGPKVTPEMTAHLKFGQNEYRFALKAEVNGSMTIVREGTLWSGGGSWDDYFGAQAESRLKGWIGKASKWGSYLSKEHYVAESVKGWVVYHVHDTSKTAPMRRKQALSNHRELQPDAGNIAPFLRRMREQHALHYRRICDTIRQVAPFFEEFLLEEEDEGESKVTRLEWKQKGSSFPFQPWQLSDGTIRFICLATALLQPEPPSTIVIDEPELGLHPFALELLASLIHETSERTQVIVSTQSPLLLNNFEPEQVIVVDRVDGASQLRRLDAASLVHWLTDYALGELLQKNVIEASPRYES
jgi:predicted ATPase